MRTEIKRRGRPSEHSEEAQANGAKWGKNSWGVGRGGVSVSPPNGVHGLGQSPRKIGIFEVYDCQKCNFNAGNAGHSRQIDILF